MEDCCWVDLGCVGTKGNPGADELDGRCPATKGWRWLQRDRPTQPFWKVVEKIMVCHLAAIKFYPCLHGGQDSQSEGWNQQQLRLIWHSNWPGWSMSHCIKSLLTWGRHMQGWGGEESATCGGRMHASSSPPDIYSAWQGTRKGGSI